MYIFQSSVPLRFYSIMSHVIGRNLSVKFSKCSMSRPGPVSGENIHTGDSPSGVVLFCSPFVQSARTSDYDRDSVAPRTTRPLESEKVTRR